MSHTAAAVRPRAISCGKLRHVEPGGGLCQGAIPCRRTETARTFAIGTRRHAGSQDPSRHRTQRQRAVLKQPPPVRMPGPGPISNPGRRLGRLKLERAREPTRPLSRGGYRPRAGWTETVSAGWDHHLPGCDARQGAVRREHVGQPGSDRTVEA